ncbi:hypothetical protein [Nitrincola sp. A-D6]|uniref:hypothetical protein n=1 Tax=Nitrincola sp. A-D6 TaxID=1545442 RepID=UPI00190FB123|nr:hypothetical protein [Nitrincola sp. A-D6]
MLAPFCERESAEEPVIRFGAEAIDWWSEHTGVVARKGSLVLSTTRDRNELVRFGNRTRDFALLNEAEVAELEPDLGGIYARHCTLVVKPILIRVKRC